MITSGMKKGVPENQRANFVPVMHNEAELKKLVDYKEPDDAYVVVLDRSGKVAFQTHGATRRPDYAQLRTKVREPAEVALLSCVLPTHTIGQVTPANPCDIIGSLADSPTSHAFLQEAAPVTRRLGVAASSLRCCKPAVLPLPPRTWTAILRRTPPPSAIGRRSFAPPRSQEPARHHAAAERASASRRLALRQGQRRVDAGEVQGVRLRRADRDLLRAVPHSEGARGRTAGADAVRGQAAGAAAGRRSHLAADRRAAAHLQRLLERRRRHRSAGVRELRRARRLRAARAPGRVGEGRDRDRALRRRVARHQAQGRRRAWRDRLHHLFRSAR